MATDEALAQAVARGDGRALEELIRRWERPLHAFLHRQTGGRDVEDLHQETWLRVVRAAPRFDPRRRFSTWMFQIALNLCRDWHRRAPLAPAEPRLDVPAEGRGTAEHTEAALDVRSLLAMLPEPQRSAVVLRYCNELSEDEVAEVLDCPRGTVKSRLHAGMRRLAAAAAERRRS